MFAHLLADLSNDHGGLRSVRTSQLMRQAARIAINRTVAGMHFPIDSVAGALLGLTLAVYLVNLCKGQQEGYRSYCQFNGEALSVARERR